MKKLILFRTLILSLFISILSSCEGNKDMLMYDEENSNFVYFAPPFKLDQFGKPLSTREDSLTFSFGFAELGTTEHVFKVPVNIAGKAFNKDREYIVELVESETTAIIDQEYAPIQEKNVFRAGLITDTLYVKVFTSEALKKGYKRIVINMLPSNDFRIGPEENSEIILSYTNLLNQPDWWKYWTKYLGPFCQEKYQKFINVYPLPEEGRAYDLNTNNNSIVYWGNMPTSTANIAQYAVTLLKIAVLKDYFAKNIVYIDGDPDKGRVKLP